VRSPQTLAGYVAELDRVTTALDTVEQHPEQGVAAAASLPDRWVVTAGSSSFEVPAEDLKIALDIHTAESLGRVRRRLSLMREAATTYDQRQFDAPAARQHLDRILARREFRNVHGPTWLDRLKERIVAWLLHVAGHLFGMSSFPAVSRILVWILVGLAVAVTVFVAYRLIRRRTRFESINPGVLPVSAKGWGKWMREARDAAAQENWREAIHLAYWAGISLLEAQGSWRPDRARTPREYLRLLPAASQFHPTLTALTRRFEIIWYGYQTADQSAFAQTLKELEELGCR